MDQVMDRLTEDHPGFPAGGIGLHGTFERCWSSIAATGLLAHAGGADRAHIHMVGRVHSSGKQQGVRAGTDVLVKVDVGAFLRSGGVVYVVPETGVLLSPGDADGRIPPTTSSRSSTLSP